MIDRGQGRHSPLLVIGAGIVVALVLVGLLAPLIAPHDPRAITGDSLERPSAQHLLGTNDSGQDVFSQVVWGTRTSMVVVTGAASLTVALGVLIGVGTSLLGGLVDAVVTRVIDILLAMPMLPLLLLVGALAGPHLGVLILTVGLTAWPRVARIARSQTLTLRQRGFLAAAGGFGAGPLYLLRRHLAPELGPTIVANLVNWAAITAGLEAAVAFLGLADPLAVSWGAVMDRALAHPGLYFTPLWLWWVLPAGLAITVAVLGFTFLGVGLEPRFNPRWRRAL